MPDAVHISVSDSRLMTRRHTAAQRFSLTDHPDLATLVRDFRAAVLEDSGMVEQIGRAGAVLASKRGVLPDRGAVQN